MATQPPPIVPRALDMMQHTFVIVQCAIDGNVWDRNKTMVPPCQHTDQEWADWAAANGKPPNSPDTPLARWLFNAPAPSSSKAPSPSPPAAAEPAPPKDQKRKR